MISAENQATFTLEPELISNLTDMDRQVLVLIANSYTGKDIAELISVTPTAARGRINRMYARIGTNKSAEATMIAIKSGLVRL